jgi:hypothetical protein
MSAPTLHPDFKEFLLCLKSHGVRFMIVGAHALAVIGRPRTTNDIDVLGWITIPPLDPHPNHRQVDLAGRRDWIRLKPPLKL